MALFFGLPRGVGYVDVMPNALSGIYYELAERRRAWVSGTCSLIEQARQRFGLRLSCYFVPGCGTMPTKQSARTPPAQRRLESILEQRVKPDAGMGSVRTIPCIPRSRVAVDSSPGSERCCVR